MAKKLEICLSYLPTGNCSDCNENRPDIQFTIELPEEYNGDDAQARYVKDHWDDLLSIADTLIMDNYDYLFDKPESKQEWFALFFRENRHNLSKVRIVYGIDVNDKKTRMCKKIHSGTNLLERDVVEQLVAPIWIDSPEPNAPSNK